MVQLCPRLKSQGNCNDSSCTFRHDIYTCEDCGVLCTNSSAYNSHLRGRGHQRQIAGLNIVLRCPLCNINIKGPMAWEQHMRTREHRRKTELMGVSVVEPEEPAGGARNEYCAVCNMAIERRHWAKHVQSPKHRKKEHFAKYKTTLEEAERDKHGVTVSGDLDFGIVSPKDAEKYGTVFKRLTVETTIPSARVKIIQAKLSTADATKSSVFDVTISGDSLMCGRPLTGQIMFRTPHPGRYEDRVEILFEDQALLQRFVIVRPIKVIVGNKADHELLRPTAPYVPRKRTDRAPEISVFPGPPPPALEVIKYVVKLGKAEIPKQLANVLSSGSNADILGQVRRMFLPETWDVSSYGRHFKYLIWVEEHRMENDLEMYDISDAKLSKNGPYYHLDVPGLAENRPSVMVGDRIHVQKHGNLSGQWYEGTVHFVLRESVGLRFHPSFQGWSPSQQYNIRFKLNRIPLRRAHQALDTAFTQARILLPLQSHVQPQTKRPPFRVLNPIIATNAPQLAAVTSIVKQKPGDVPFVIFGPPGTGKTVTVVEAIRQVLAQNPTAHILACAPSNSAADLIATRLKALGKDVLFRFYAPSRHKDLVPDELNEFTVKTRDGHFSVPPIAVLKRFRVIVSTCVSGSVCYGIGIPRGHFSHIFFDEAGQATEPETMITIKTMADNATNIILSGDPKQLGPIIRSSIARELGLEKSYLERLMGRGELYDETQGHGKTVVKLVKNFRSHNAILQFPNEKFYGGELQPCADTKVINSYIGSSHLVSRSFPIVFHALYGKDDREASSPSFFNVDEVTQVKAHIEALRADRRYRITDQEIGVIAPYHAQCRKIRMALKAVADGVKVGSVEEFQGQERKVIVISTVRSSREFVSYDLKHTLGFVANPRRFNVAVTRAKSLLIIVGDPSVLSLDPLWRSFLNYIHINNGWKGPQPGWDTRAPVIGEGGYDQRFRETGLADMNAFTRRMESLTLSGVDDDDDDESSDADANVDRPWREVE